MKKRLTSLLLTSLLALAFLPLSAQNGQRTLSGRITNPDDVAVDFATVTLRSKTDSTKMYGETTDQDGHFTLKAPSGDYLFRATFLGYTPLEKELSLQEATELGTLILTPSSVEMDAVVVRGEMVTREADRFVVNVGSSPLSIGQTAKEMLELSPAVWVDEKTGISINGKSNTQVIVNERIVRETGEDLINYLYTIKAEDIVRIEVIPVGGVEYEASAQGGVIKITLRRQRNNGVEGSLSMRYGTTLNHNRPMESFQPNFNINYRANKLSLYSTVSENHQTGTSSEVRERHAFFNGHVSKERALYSNKGDMPSLRAGAIFDFNENHSVGVEANLYGFFPWRNTMTNNQHITGPDGYTENINSFYLHRNTYRSWNLSGNYIARLDTVGSTFKLLLDYVRTHPENSADYDNLYDTNGVLKDSVYRSRNESWNNLYSVGGDFDLKAGKRGRVKTGFKYMFSNVDNDAAYDYFKNDRWSPIPDRTHRTLYDEHISALYGNYSCKFANKIGLGFGLRVEHTYAQPKAGELNIDEQNYFSFFPNANLSLPLNKQESHQLIFSYARKIRRPSFWNLIPRRWTDGETVAYEGNPKLKPCYSDEVSVSWVIAKKYNVTAGAYLMKDDWTQVPRVDADDPNLVVWRPENLKNRDLWYLSINLPFDVAKWWRVNANIGGRLTWYEIDGMQQDNHRLSGNISNTFTVCDGTSFTLNANASTASKWGYSRFAGNYRVDAGIAQKFWKNRITANVQVNNIFNSTNSTKITDSPGLYMEETGYWGRPNMTVSVRYNFKAGKDFKAKTVESGADTSRISGQ